MSTNPRMPAVRRPSEVKTTSRRVSKTTLRDQLKLNDHHSPLAENPPMAKTICGSWKESASIIQHRSVGQYKVDS